MEKGDDLTAITEFEIALSKIYQEDPCLVLPNAFALSMITRIFLRMHCPMISI